MLTRRRLCEAAAVLAGTMLMASSVSGSGPDTHDSSVSLTSLLPKIATPAWRSPVIPSSIRITPATIGPTYTA